MSNIQVNPRKMTLFAMVAALAISLAIPSVAVFASSGSVNVMTTRPSYTGTAMIKVVGVTTVSGAHSAMATITITGPHGGPAVATATAPVIHGAFYWTFTSGGAKWHLSGTYTVTATVKGVSGTTTFTYTA